MEEKQTLGTSKISVNDDNEKKIASKKYRHKSSSINKVLQELDFSNVLEDIQVSVLILSICTKNFLV